MSLDRQDVRAKLDHDYHAALVAICNRDGISIGEFTERLLLAAIESRVHDAIQLAQDKAVLGIAGKVRESAGRGGK